MNPPDDERRRGGGGVSSNGNNRSLSVPALPEGVPTLTAELSYADAGLYVLPVKRGQKHPGSVVGKGWPTLSSRDPEQIVAWYAGTDYGIALHAGRSGVVVFDVDHPHQLPALLTEHLHSAPYQSTRHSEPGRGHYVFAVPDGVRLGNGTGQLGKGWGEVRGDNGVIIVSPSEHESEAGRYLWERTGPVPVLPDALLAALPTPTGTPEVPATDGEVEAFLEHHTATSGLCTVQGPLTRFAEEVAAKASRHDSAVSVACWAMREAAEGHYPAREAAQQIGQAFLAAVGSERNARSEWAGILAWRWRRCPRRPSPSRPPSR